MVKGLLMTEKEYKAKLQMYQTSDASVEVKAQAIEKLNKEYGADAIIKANAMYEESKPDLDDIGN
jgi:hypothetical protein